MKSQRLVRVCWVLLVVCWSTNAWPWPQFGGLLVRRQEDAQSTPEDASPSSARPSEAASQADGAKSDSKNAAEAGKSGSEPADESKDASSTDESDTDEKDSESSEESTDDESKPKSDDEEDDDSDEDKDKDKDEDDDEATSTTDIDPRLPPGGINMITPAPLSGSQYYKIGDYVTFGWNYTSLSVTPKSIDVMASCSLNNQLYTIAVNQSVEKSQMVVWDTEAEATNSAPPPMDTYTLFVYDSDEGLNARPSAGYLSVYNQFRFGMYQPRAYTPLSDFVCASCSRASSGVDTHALGFLLGMAAVTCLSFTWFVTGLHHF
ncbi:MAG: hypothetical protein M1815_006317 [Lichina confinis]|nr:MAG: hypothetical protein M1815_006317 [Lichina confinis]